MTTGQDELCRAWIGFQDPQIADDGCAPAASRRGEEIEPGNKGSWRLPEHDNDLASTCSDLRCADPGDHARRADGTRANPDLHRVGTGLDQRGRRGPGGDVAADHLDTVTDDGLEPVHHVQHESVVCVGGVNDQHVDARVDQRHRACPRVVADTDGCADQQPAVAVFGGQRELFCLDEVLDGDQPGELAVTVDDRQLLNLVAAQQT